ncbi:AMP-dependent synthetase [Sphingobium algorifonticola]|uniref:AMP-dependent synthetase n=1 Tax=Sphingobium algorifonticola TaxID=2008318 RepID=A0A437JDP4_9SPHN|nr:AMP-dependent synthetase [Sphingobium algorifonticola]
MDAAIARMTGPGGLLQLGHVARNGAMLPYVVSAPQTLPALFATYCAHYGNRPFLVDGAERLTFAQAYALARRAAGGLVAGHGVKPGDRIGLAARNGAGWVIAYMAIAMAGGIATLLNGWWSGQELAEAIADTGCSLVLADGRREAALHEAGIPSGATLVRIRQTVPVAEGLAALNALGGDETTALPEMAPDDDATILFTSGSTGRSKGALSDQRAVVQGALNFVSATLSVLDVMTQRGSPPTHLPATLVCVPLFHVTAEITILLQSFVIGRKLVMMPKWDAEEAMRLIAAEQITYFISVPLMSYEIATHPHRDRYDLSTLKDVASGGAPRPPEQLRRIVDGLAGANPVIGYGLTETNAVGCGNFREAYLAKPDSTGRATRPLTEVAIVDADGRSLPQGQRGEIAIRSIANIKGYWNRPQDTTALFTADGFVRTGDIGYMDADGYVFIVDRLKDIIIRGGENISGPEVEAALYAHPAVKECAVFGQPDARLGEVPVAVVYLREGMNITGEALRLFLGTHLAPFKIPARIWIAEAPLPCLGSLKIDKRALRDRYAEAAIPADS